MRQMRLQLRFLLALLLISALAGCKSYSNLSDYKADLIRYYQSGDYEREVAKVMKRAQTYVAHRAEGNNDDLAVVLDVDDTALSNWSYIQDMYLGYNKAAFEAWAIKANAPAIPPVLEFCEFAKKHGVKIFMISARPARLQQATEQNLKSAGYLNYDALVVRPENGPKLSTAAFKAEARQKLVQQGFTIIANIGDQESDLRGGFSEKEFKIPNPFYTVAW